jgi:hypothetical protein
MTGTRARLNDRRPHWLYRFECDGQAYTGGMRPAEPRSCRTLIPFNRNEAITLGEAAGIAGKSVGTARNWCIQHGLGRRIGSGTRSVSKVALAMFLDDDMVALAAYQSGDRSSPIVFPYLSVSRLGRLALRPLRTFHVQSADDLIRLIRQNDLGEPS